jgi:hypothetical protein
VVGWIFLLTFFLVRFLFLAWRDIAAIRLELFASGSVLDKIAQAMVADNRIFVDRAEGNEAEIKETVRRDATIEETKRLIDEQEALEALQPKLQERTDLVLGLIGNFLRRRKVVDRYLIYFEVGFPCLLVFALACLFSYRASDQHFWVTLLAHQ